MNKREFINKIESLKSIKPDASWVALTRDEILGEKRLFPVQANFAGLFFNTRTFVATAALVLFGGIFLYSHLLISSDQLAEEAERIAKQDKVQMLSTVLADLKDARAETRQSFAESVVSKPEEEVVKIARDIAPLLIEIDEKEAAIMGSLGIIITEPEDLSPNRDIADFLIADLEKRSLTEEEKLLLDEAKKAFEAEDYQEALRKVLQIGTREEEK